MKQVPPRRSLLVAAAAALAGCGAIKAPPPLVPPQPPFAALARTTCNEEAFQAHNPNGAWVHPQQNYYAPGAKAPTEDDMKHLLVNDAAVVVRYRPDAPRSQRAVLRDWAATQVSAVVLPALRPDAAQVEAFTINRHLICDGADPNQLTVFADRRGSLRVTPHPSSGTG